MHSERQRPEQPKALREEKVSEGAGGSGRIAGLFTNCIAA